MNNIKWRALSGTAAVLVACWFQIMWLWGLIILLLVVPDIRSGHTHFFEPVSRRDNPKTFWFINITWLVLAVCLLLLW
ncbi:hypothetical protein ACWJJH_19775 [Endozoicomonadaceae bacterium StTr2]